MPKFRNNAINESFRFEQNNVIMCESSRSLRITELINHRQKFTAKIDLIIIKQRIVANCRPLHMQFFANFQKCSQTSPK